MKIRSMLVAVLVLAVFAMAACSNDDSGGGGGATGGETGGQAATVSTDTYVSGLCTAMGTYVTDVQTITDDFTSSLDPAAAIEDQKTAVLTYLDDVITTTETMVSDVQAIGVPDVDNGDAVVAALQESFGSAKAVLEDARSTVDGLSTADPVAFGKALIDLGTSLQTSLGDVSDSLSALDSQALSEAAAAAPACAQFASAVGTT
jgi:hypothetical protein